jgi:signal peptidase II
LPTLLTLIGCAAAAAALDQVSKIFVTRRCAEGRFYEFRAGCGLLRVHNQRGAIVTLPSGGAAALLAGVGVLGAALLLGSAGPVKGAAVGFGLALGGAAGNLTDRFARGSVVDFIALRWWPTFNLADAALVVGLTLTFWSFLR